nr:RNA-directed DNA polymerase, eukaryota, reverse transcriptase zinc-binding domain protein [Tanacetum cinerariifolium]
MNVVHYGKQSVLCKMKAVRGELFMFCTIVYASNGGNERIELWKDLRLYSRMVGSFSWAILGDMNVTLDPKEHSAMTKDMIDFKECVNDIEVDDVASSRLFFTWTKNLFKTKNDESAGILKKLDKIMGNEGLISKYPQAHAIFLPYLIYDHYPVVLVIPNSLQTRRKAFRFANFVTSKKEFKKEVLKYRGSCKNGCKMFRVVKDLEALKKPLKMLASKDRDLFEDVKSLRDRLKEVKAKIDVNPSNKMLEKKRVISWLTIELQ